MTESKSRYFTISGYFYRKNQSVIKPVVKNLLILIVAEIANALCCGFDYYISQLKSNGVWNVIWCGFAGWTPGWFILGLIYAYLLMWLFDKLKISKWVFIIIVPLLMIFLWIGQRFNTIGIVRKFCFYTSWLRVLTFFMLGHHIRENEDKIKNVSNKIWTIVLLAGILLTLAERWLLTNVFNISAKYFLYLGIFVSIVGAFCLALGCEEWNLPFLKFVGCNLSMYIYVVHMAVITLARNHGYEFDSLWICVGSLMVSLVIFCIKYFVKNIYSRYLRK